MIIIPVIGTLNSNTGVNVSDVVVSAVVVAGDVVNVDWIAFTIFYASLILK